MMEMKKAPLVRGLSGNYIRYADAHIIKGCAGYAAALACGFPRNHFSMRQIPINVGRSHPELLGHTQRPDLDSAATTNLKEGRLDATYLAPQPDLTHFAQSSTSSIRTSPPAGLLGL
jgi:hypothetical protein